MIESKRLQAPVTPRRRSDMITLPDELLPPSSLSYEGPLLVGDPVEGGECVWRLIEGIPWV